MRDRLLAEVAAAFPSAPLHPELFADPTGDWRDLYDHAEELESAISGKTWDMLDSSLVETHHNALIHMRPAAFVAVLPAYLVAFIKNDGVDALPGYLITALTRGPRLQDDFDARVGLMTEAQWLVVARALAATLQDTIYPRRKPDIREALASYWGVLLDPDEWDPRAWAGGALAGTTPESDQAVRERSLAEVTAAFPPTPVSRSLFGNPDDPDDVENQLWREGYERASEFEAAISGKTWDMLDSQLIERYHDVLRHIPPAAFAAVLPAYLVAFIKNDDDLASLLPNVFPWHLTRGNVFEDEFDSRVAAMTEAQRLAVARALMALRHSGIHLRREDDIQAALDSYWGALLTRP